MEKEDAGKYDPFSPDVQMMHKEGQAKRRETKLPWYGEAPIQGATLMQAALASQNQHRETVIGDPDTDDEEEKVSTPAKQSNMHVIGEEEDEEIITTRTSADSESKVSLEPNEIPKSQRSSGDQSTSDEERGANMKKMLAELLLKMGSDESRRYSTIDDSRLTAKSTVSASSKTSNDEEVETALGIKKTSIVYPQVKKFCETLRKRIKNNRTKKQVIQEMVTTERTYSKGLEWLIQWRDELKLSKIIEEKEITDLFSNVIDSIKQISDIFIKDITKRYESWTKDSDVGDIYQSIAPFFKLYVDYCNNNELSGKTLSKLMIKNKKFKEYVLQEEKKAGNSFESFLITPIQRIPRYEMLIGAALKYTNKDKSDFPKLQKALELVQKVCQDNNRSMALYTGQRRKIELQDMFGDKINLMLPQRYLIEEFPNLYMVDVNTNQVKECTLILFSDCIAVVLNIRSINRSTYFGSTEFHENSFIYAKTDLKYYKNLIKIVGKTK
jgi:hypothetical protein